MATQWVKSLQCKSSKVVEDVHNPISKHLLLSQLAGSSLSGSGCKLSVHTLKTAIETTTTATKPGTKPKQNRKPRKTHIPKSPTSPRITKSASMPVSNPTRIRHSSSARSARNADPGQGQGLPTLKELPEGHPARNVVEIIFHTSWSPKAFPGRIQTVFKVHNPTRVVTRFEEYREMIKNRAGSSTRGDAPAAARGEADDSARCAADGNEVMRFQCLGPTSGADAGGCSWTVGGGSWSFGGGGARKGASAICTFSGSGAAHEKGGGGRGRWAMLVCRVVAGRVGFDSVGCGGGDGDELLVLDTRAVLPCFLVVYKL